MTIEEKLQHFYDVSVEEASGSANQALEEHKKHLAKMFSDHKQTRQQDAQAQIKAETENAKREINKALSAQQLTLKRNLTARENELKDELFVEVKERLTQFMSTTEYEDYLVRKIKEAVDFAKDDELFIFLSPEDEGLKHTMMARTGFPVQISKEPFIGGIRATIPSKNILIDNSFMESLHTLRKEFSFDGGPKA